MLFIFFILFYNLKIIFFQHLLQAWKVDPQGLKIGVFCIEVLSSLRSHKKILCVCDHSYIAN